MEPEKIESIIRELVAQKFGEDRIKRIDSFGPCEDEDLNVLVFVEGIDRNSKEVWDLRRKIRHKLDKLDLDVPFGLFNAKSLETGKLM
ncbi:MAG: hypothetical protein ACE5J3_07420 [Methanosarcinales archaeon]